MLFCLAEKRPWAAGHGKSVGAWDSVLRELQAKGFFVEKTTRYLQARVKDLIRFKEDPPREEENLIDEPGPNCYSGLKKNKFRLNEHGVCNNIYFKIICNTNRKENLLTIFFMEE